jgi:aminopeptidase-like protein
MDMMDLLKKIYPLRLAPVSSDTDKAVEIFKKELDFKVHEYKSGDEHNGWIVPQSWKVIKAEIRKDGQLIYDGKESPLGVKGYSKSFKGKVSLTELKKHLTYRDDWPYAVGYHCDYYYKPWTSDWGFSIPYHLYNTLEEGKYDVDLKVSFDDNTMKICDFFLPGEKKDTIILNAHNCHAGQANDDIAGCVVGVEIMKRLMKQKNKYSYRLIIAPEHFGTVFYLNSVKKDVLETFKFCIFMEMLGNDKKIAFQESFTGESLMDSACCHYLTSKYGYRKDENGKDVPDYDKGKYRHIVGNDESVWESPGYEIPTVSISRWPYPEYHTSMDDEKIISKKRLEEGVDTILGIIDIFETNCTMKRKFDGLVALSNPKYDLYISPGIDPSMDVKKTKERWKWYHLMDCLPRYFDEKTTILDVAKKHKIEYRKLYEYVQKFKDKGLVDFIKH